MLCKKLLPIKQTSTDGKFSSRLMPELGKQGCAAAPGKKTLQTAVPTTQGIGGDSYMGSKQVWWTQNTLQKSHLQLSPSTPQYAVQSAGLGLCNLHGLITRLHLKVLPPPPPFQLH